MDRKTNPIGYLIAIALTAIITYLIVKNFDKPDPPVVDVDPPKEIITLPDAFQLYETYSRNRSCLIDIYEAKIDSTLNTLCPSDRPSDIGFVPSRSFHLDKKFLEQYLAYINQVTGDTIEITGYSIFLGNYPNKDRLISGKPINDPRRNTIFIAPTTFQNGTKTPTPFTYTEDQNNDGKPDLLFLNDEFERRTPTQQKPKAKVNTASFFSLSPPPYGVPSTIANEVGGYPPNYQ